MEITKQERDAARMVMLRELAAEAIDAGFFELPEGMAFEDWIGSIQFPAPYPDHLKWKSWTCHLCAQPFISEYLGKVCPACRQEYAAEGRK